MTAREVFDKVMIELEFRNTNFLGAEFNYHFQASIEEWMKGKMPLLDSDQEVDDYLRFLRVRDKIVPVTDMVAKIPDRYRRLTRVQITIEYQRQTKPGCKPEAPWALITRKCERLTDDKANYILNDPFDCPRAEKPYHQLTGNDLKIITEKSGSTMIGYTVKTAILNYILEPTPLVMATNEFGELVDETGPEVTDPLLIRKDSQTDLPDRCLLEIIPICARRMLEVKGDPRYQTQITEKQIAAANQARPPG
jgi:hypothetical protein